MLQDVDTVESGDRSSRQGLKFENMSSIRGQKNSFSQINNQTTDIAEVASCQDLSMSSVDRGALPLRPQDAEEQINSQVALRPDTTSRPVIQDTQVTHLRLEMGINICAVNCNPDILLLLTASEDHGGNVIHGLLENGANVAVKDSYEWTPLHKAAESGRETVVRLLLRKGADVSAKENIGRTPLHWAAENGYEAVARLLIEKGAEVSAEDSIGRTALHRAAEKGQKAMTELLLESSAAVGARDHIGRTALHWAAEGGHREVARLLHKKGADIAAEDILGRTTIRWAEENRQKMMVALLTSLSLSY